MGAARRSCSYMRDRSGFVDKGSAVARTEPASNRRLNLLLINPEIDLPHAAQLRKFSKRSNRSWP
jgi:hypothetical protein